MHLHLNSTLLQTFRIDLYAWNIMNPCHSIILLTGGIMIKMQQATILLKYTVYYVDLIILTELVKLIQFEIKCYINFKKKKCIVIEISTFFRFG